MQVHFGDHGRFQRGASVLAAVGTGVGLLTWGWGIEGMQRCWVAGGLGLAVAGAAVRESLLLRRRRAVALAAIAGASIAAAVFAGATWNALVGGAPDGAWGAVGAGLLAAIATTPALAAAGVRVVWPGRVARALARTRPVLGGEEWALVQRAGAAHDRISIGLAGSPGAEGRRLRRLAGSVTLQVLALARRGRQMRGEVERVDLPAVRRRAGLLSERASGTVDESARADLVRAARSAVALDERARALAEVAERLRARLEREVATLEETALAVAAQQASAAVGEAAGLAPMAERLLDAGRELQEQAQALVDLN